MSETWIRGGWLQTATGGKFFPLSPGPSQINIRDIAASLSKMCRFGGHCRRFYSVAEHSVLIASKAPEEYKLCGLLHDASEAYLSDIPRPVKKMLPDYLVLERSIMDIIAYRFGFPWPIPEPIKDLDLQILFAERTQNMVDAGEEWENEGMPELDVTLQFWPPDRAEYEFLSAFKVYYDGVDVEWQKEPN